MVSRPLLASLFRDAQHRSAMGALAPRKCVQGTWTAHRAYRCQLPERESFLNGPALEVPPHQWILGFACLPIYIPPPMDYNSSGILLLREHAAYGYLRVEATETPFPSNIHITGIVRASKEQDI